MYYYLPSCKVKQNHIEASSKIQNYLKQQGVTILGCCKLTNGIFNEDDIVITNCTSCSIIINEQYPTIKEISLYEYLLNDNNFIWPNYENEEITIQDCYRSIHKIDNMKYIRKCLEKMNFKIVELEDNFGNTKFDGIFKYKAIDDINLKLAPNYFNNFKDHMSIKTNEEIKDIMIKHVSNIKTNRVVCYCNACYVGLKLGNANTVHMIDLLTKNI